ncbi:hypothetical protein IAG44_42295 [Streptomyces roseirectus]|uniref:Uncharacterized protein n=1 Tax=Streptomyces roseirectus TaxID=2768066 RepID=A0A7H0IRH1_9ACTN|nr:hypothetical protein [Streptomyces roseirectus]QNP75387.1 hypothetical protein IAG44_42295 [Streptomyces roseirectus]
MDYCSTCRRHLNGALVCPGCGAYAPDIAPLPGGAPAPIAAATAAPVVHDEPAPHLDDASADDVSDGAYEAAATGRAARRRQRERWKKTQRRALVATAVALVGGGLTVASMNRQTPDRTQAASAPDRETMGIAEEEVTEPTPGSGPGSAASDTHRSVPGAPQDRSSGASRSAPRAGTPHTPDVSGASRGQSAAQPQAAPAQAQNRPAPAAGPVAQRPAPAPASPASPAPAPAPGSQDAPKPSPGGTGGTATQPTPSPAPSTPGTGTGTGGSAGSGSASDATDPAGLCLLGLVCIK